MRTNLLCALLCAISLAAAPPLRAQATAAKPIRVQAGEMSTLTFTVLFANLKKEFEVGIAPDKFSLSILEALRAAGYNVVGAENVLFAVDKSASARMLLGGTITDVTRHKNLPGDLDYCDIEIAWELFDRAADAVVYKKLTRYRIDVPKKILMSDVKLKELVLGALASLLASPRFVDAVRKAPEATGPSASAAATYRACSAVPRALPAEIDAVIAASASLPAFGGAGVFISPDGVLLTANHVVAGLDEVSVKLRDGTSLLGRVVRRDPSRDVAVLRVQGAPESCVPVSAAWPEVGTEVFAIGGSPSKGLEFSVSRGIVSGTPDVNGRKVIQTDASLNPGNSGGPLVDAKGRLLGVVAAKWVGVDLEGIGFAVHADTALTALGLSAGAATTLEDAAAGPIAAAAPVVIDEPDLSLADPTYLARQRQVAVQESIAKSNREKLPYRLPAALGTMLLLGGAIPFVSGAVFLSDSEDRTSEREGIITMSVGGAAMAVGIVVIAVSAGVKHRLERKKERNRLDFGLAPLDGGRGGALLLGGSF